MKKLFLIFALALMIFALNAQIALAGYVRGYYRSNGTYVQPYYRSNPNGLRYDNYSYKSYQPLFNNSYGRYNTYKWNTPSWSWQSDYYTGLNYYNSYNSYRSNSLYDSLWP